MYKHRLIGGSLRYYKEENRSNKIYSQRSIAFLHTNKAEFRNVSRTNFSNFLAGHCVCKRGEVMVMKKRGLLVAYIEEL